MDLWSLLWPTTCTRLGPPALNLLQGPDFLTSVGLPWGLLQLGVHISWGGSLHGLPPLRGHEVIASYPSRRKRLGVWSPFKGTVIYRPWAESQ